MPVRGELDFVTLSKNNNLCYLRNLKKHLTNKYE